MVYALNKIEVEQKGLIYMGLKFIYFMKLFLIIFLSALLLASVNIIFETPMLFLGITAICTVSIRFLWKSILKSEYALQRPREPLRENKHTANPSDRKQAA